MTENHPITPPPELVQQLLSQCPGESDNLLNQFANLMARWGADQELKACCNYMQKTYFHGFAKELRAARRPNPPSLAEEGQRILVENGSTLDGRVELDPEDVATIRAALIRLQELEQLND